MSSGHAVEFLDGCHHSTADEIVDLKHAIITEGVCFHPATKFHGAIEEYNHTDARVCIMLATSNNVGLYMGLTPEGARNYAAALLRMAAMVDAAIEKAPTASSSGAVGGDKTQ